MYRHALPPGFVLKKDKKKEEKEEDKISLEELIENEVRLEGGDTHTLCSFLISHYGGPKNSVCSRLSCTCGH